MKTFLRSLPKFAAALAFAGSMTAAVVVGGAEQAGSPATPFNAAPQAADAAVFVRAGYRNYPRWRWDGYRRSWVRAGFFYGRPGFFDYAYLGYAPPVGPPYWAVSVGYVPFGVAFYAPFYYGGYYAPYYRAGFYGRPFYGGYYGRPFYGGSYGRGYYGRGGYYGRANYGAAYGRGAFYGRGGFARGGAGAGMRGIGSPGAVRGGGFGAGPRR